MNGSASCASCGGALGQASTTSGVCERCLLQGALRDSEQEIRAELLQICSAAERRVYLDEICRDDAELHKRILCWLQSLGPDSPGNLEEPSRADEEADDRRIGGRYQLLRKIGEGGFGTVHLAAQLAPMQRRVAVKILKLGMDTRQVVARFELERQTLALMDHPNIAKVFDAGATESGRPYFVMELVRGVPITQYCQQQQLSIPRRLELFGLVCQAVQHAHQKGIIHRDLKPSNILVTASGGNPAPKVIDFGIAKAIQQELPDQTVLTLEHHLLGTPAYISPEQAGLTSADIDTRSDIYSLGVLLYELLTGSTPFDTKELTQRGIDAMRRIILEREPLRPSVRLRDLENSRHRIDSEQSKSQNRKSKIDKDLDWIVLKCLEKDRALRYATANGLAMDIQRYLAHEPIVARPPSLFYRISKLVRRNLLVTSLAALLFLALLSAMVAGASMSLRIAKGKQETDQVNRRLSQTVRYLESQKMEELSMEGRHSRLLAWLASHLRKDPADHVAASRTLSMLSLRNFALPALPPFVHGGPVNTAWFSPDGTQILTASDDRTVRFWDVGTGRPLRVITNDTAVAGAWYWAGSGHVMASTRDGVLRIYDASGRNFLFEVLQAGWAVTAKDWLYVALRDQTLARWDVRSGQRVEPTLSLSAGVFQMEASETGGWLAVACSDNTVRLVNASTGEWLAPLQRFDSVVYLRTAPDGGRLFISFDAGRRVAIWDTRSTNAISEFVPPVPIHGMHFTPDGRRMLTFGWKTPPRIWDAEGLRLLHELSWGAEIQGWTEYGTSGDGRQVTGVSQNGMMRIWDIETGRPVLEPFEHEGWARTLVFNSSNTHVLSGSQDGTARLWDTRMRKPAPVSLPLSAGGSEASFNRTGTRLVVGVDLDAVQICDARTGLAVSPLLRHSGGREVAHIRTASFSHDDARLLTVGEEGIVGIWNATSYQLERKLVLKHPVAIAQFSPDDRFVVVGDRRGHATIWSAESGVQLGAIPDYVEEALSLAFPPQGATFAAGCVNGTARCYTLPSGEPAGPLLQHRGIVWSVAYSPDGTRILTASADRTAQIWDAQSGRPLLKPLRHEKDVRSARFSPDGKWILTTSEDGTARVWSAVTAEPLSVLRHSAMVQMGAFSPDSRWVATGSEDRTVRLWDPLSGLPMSESVPHTGPLVRLAFSPDGKRLLAFGGQPKLWDVMVAPTPVPPWFCELAEAVGGSRFGPDGEALPASPQIIATLRERLGSGKEKDFYSRWAEWFLLDRMKDPVPAFGAE